MRKRLFLWGDASRNPCCKQSVERWKLKRDVSQFNLAVKCKLRPYTSDRAVGGHVRARAESDHAGVD